MATVVKRVPPPPPIAVNDPTFNRWLHDLTAFIGEGGGIDTGTIPGYDALTSTVATHTTQIASNTVNIAANTSQIATNTSQIATHTSQIATHTSQIAALTARSQVLHGTAPPTAGLGADGDWFANTVTPFGTYVKISGAWIKVA